MNSPFLLRSFLALLALVLTSCASKDNPNQPRDRFFFDSVVGTDSYSKTFEKFTRIERVHSELEPVMTAFVTLWGSEMREAFLQEQNRQYRLPDDEAQAMRAKSDEDYKKNIVFIVSMATREYSWNDLDKLNSMWRISLENSAGDFRAKPDEVRIVSYKDEVGKYFYKYMNNFTTTYRVAFRRDAFKDQKPAVLHISGPRGAVTLKFEID